jgi:rhomboid protease GluP
MYAFWGVGAPAERVFGNAAFLALYVVAAVAGSFVSILWTPSVVSAGASGAVFGVYGAILAFALAEGHDSLTTELAVLRKSSLGFIGYNLFYGLTMPNISNAAHLGGLVRGSSLEGC